MYIINKKLLCDDLFAAAVVAVVAVAAGVVASYEAERRLRWCQEAAESRGNWAEDDDEKAVEAAEALTDLQRRRLPS